MRALQFVGVEQDAQLRDVDDPSPRAGEVLVRVGGAGACHSDLHLMYDFPELQIPVPFTLGHENAGWVEALGDGVTGLEIGQPVAVYGPGGCGRCHTCAEGVENYCDESARGVPHLAVGLGRDGGMAPLLRVPSARHLVPLAGLDPVQAAPLTDAGLTPYHAVARSRHLLVPGSHAVVIGAGGLGHLAIQILDALTPATVIAVDPKAEALALAADVGAAVTLPPGPDAAAQIREATRGLGADLVLDLVGAESTLQLAVAVAGWRGHVTCVGIGGGTYAFSFLTVPYEVSLATTYWGSLPELHEVLRLAEQGKVRAHVQQFSLDDAMGAYHALKEGRLTGRAVIVP